MSDSFYAQLRRWGFKPIDENGHPVLEEEEPVSKETATLVAEFRRLSELYDSAKEITTRRWLADEIRKLADKIKRAPRR